MEFKKSHSRKQSHHPQDGGFVSAPAHKSVNTSGQSTPAPASPANTLSRIFRQRTFPSKRTAILIVSCLAVTIGIVYWIYSAKTSTTTVGQHKVVENLEYQTVTPRGKTIQQLGGWRRVSPPKSAPVYAYVDTIDGVQVSVSQQPLPDKFIEGTGDKLDELAKGFGATNEITANSVKVYVGTSAKGPQSALFIKNGLLILVKSQKKISNTSWKKYAEELK